jgi:integrase
MPPSKRQKRPVLRGVHLLESGTDIRIIQALLGHRRVNTTARCAQVATSTVRGTPSPLDRPRLEVMLPS